MQSLQVWLRSLTPLDVGLLTCGAIIAVVIVTAISVSTQQRRRVSIRATRRLILTMWTTWEKQSSAPAWQREIVRHMRQAWAGDQEKTAAILAQHYYGRFSRGELQPYMRTDA